MSNQFALREMVSGVIQALETYNRRLREIDKAHMIVPNVSISLNGGAAGKPAGRPSKLSTDDLNEIRAACRNGQTIQELAVAYNVSKPTIYRVSAE